MDHGCAFTARSRAAIVFTLLCACAHTTSSTGVNADPTAPIRTAIGAANAEFAKALVRGDAKGMAAVFAENGEIIPTQQRGLVTGRTAIEAYQARRLEARRYLDVEITTTQLEVAGDVAWETGTSRATIQQGQGAPIAVTGRYLAVWKREADGAWRIRVNLSVPDPF